MELRSDKPLSVI